MKLRHKGLQHETYFCNMLLQQRIKISGSCLCLVMLSTALALFRQRSSRAKVTDASRDRLRSVIHSSAPSTLPNRSAGLCRRGHIRRVAYCVMSHFLTLRANGKTLKFSIFCLRVYYEKLCHMLQLLVPKFRPDLFDRLRDITEKKKQVPVKLKPIVGVELSHFFPTAKLLNGSSRDVDMRSNF